jgi:hypothetical protein
MGVLLPSHWNFPIVSVDFYRNMLTQLRGVLPEKLICEYPRNSLQFMKAENS